MDNIEDPPAPQMYSSKVMYHITTDQYLRVVAQVVKDFGEPKRTFREVFRRAHSYFLKHESPSVYALQLEDIYNKRSLSVIISALHTKGIIDDDGFFTSAFHTAYYWKYQRLYQVRDVLIEVQS